MDNPFLALVWKRPSVKQFLCPVLLVIAKDCTERLSAVAFSVGLITPRWCHVVRASFFLRYATEMPWLRWRGKTPYREEAWQCLPLRQTKQANVVNRQRLLQTVTSLHVVSPVFRGHDLLKIANINPQQEGRFSQWKILVPRESAGNGA